MKGAFLRAGIVAGLAGGAILALYNVVGISVSVSNAAGIPMSLGSAAAVYFGFAMMVAAGRNAAVGHPANVPLGVALHFIVSLAWGLGFAFLAQTRGELTQRPLISGIGFGFVVWVVMLVVLAVSGFLQPPTPNRIAFAILGDVVFFGIPIAYTAAAMLRSSR